MGALLQYLIALSSGITVVLLAYIAREVHIGRKKVYANEERSMVNRAVLRREGMYDPVSDPSRRDS